jgi:hypothetical protein
VLGYKIFLDETLWFDASSQSTVNEFTFTGLSVGTLHRFSVSAINNIGMSNFAYLDLIASSVPQKLAPPTLVSSSEN